MKPRTKLQKQIYSLSANLPILSQEQKEWAAKHCLRHIGYRTKKTISCLDCGHIWSTSGQENLTGKYERPYPCPKCGTKLKIEVTRKKKLKQREYLAIIDTVEGFQVNRFFEMYCYHKSGEKPNLFVWEVVQQWLRPDGKEEVVARNFSLNWYGDSFSGDLEIRGKYSLQQKYDIYPTRVYPKIKCLPVYRRNGIRKSLHGCSPYKLFNSILSNTKTETLLKSKQFELLRATVTRSTNFKIDQYWDSIKICIRNGYKVKDATLWFDYMDLLRWFKRDVRSPKYICPDDVRKEHDRLVRKKNEIERKRRIEELKRKMEDAQEKYSKEKSEFFGIQFKKRLITIKVLENVQEFIEEGDYHRHCLFSNEYYKKKDSLIFSARVRGVPVETVEVSLSEMKIVQSRGLHNKASEYNPQIIDLLNKNMHVIRKKYQEIDKTG